MKNFIKCAVMATVLSYSFECHANIPRNDPWKSESYETMMGKRYFKHNEDIRKAFVQNYNNGHYMWLPFYIAQKIEATLRDYSVLMCGEPLDLNEILSFFSGGNETNAVNKMSGNRGLSSGIQIFNFIYKQK